MREIATGQRQQIAAENLGQHAAVPMGDVANDVPTDGVARSHRFEAAGSAASAPRPARSHHHVADLTGPAMRTVIELVVDDDSAADAGADEYRQHRVVAAPGAQFVFA